MFVTIIMPIKMTWLVIILSYPKNRWS